jgi:lysyl endopeptidase
MKQGIIQKLTASVLLILISLSTINAQESQGGTPPSFILNNLPDAGRVVVPKPDLAAIEEEDNQKDFYAIARLLPVNLNTHNSGKWHTLSDGSKIWRLQITLPDAKATAVFYDNFWLPEKGKLYLYNADKSQVLGAYTAANNHESKVFNTEFTYGETVVLEYFHPAEVQQEAIINISDVSYFYRGIASNNIGNGSQRDFGQAVSCMVNVNCSEGNNWQNQRNAVVRILLRFDNGSQGWCSGSLLNNTAQDCKPYILTADHCGDGSSLTSRNQWIFYFNYQAPGCSNPTNDLAIRGQTRTGCTFRSRSTGGINSGSDFYLVELNSAVPTSYNPYYAGWNRNNTASSSGVGIHHGAGDIKKISTYTQFTVSYNHSGFQTANGARWYVAWAATANGHGIIEQGSSGSSLFNNSGLVVGIASAGSVDLNCSNPSGLQTVYGKFSYSWESNGTTSDRQLKPWLHPSTTTTAPTTLQGTGPCGTTNVDANFAASSTTIFVGQSINFTDLSTGSPTAWSWTFQGAATTNSTAQNPQNITYNTAGTFNVTLTASKTGSTDTETKTGYITVLPQGTATCDTLLNFKTSDTPSLYTTGNGYVSGHNQYGDVAKAEKFTATSGSTVSQVRLFFGVAKSNTSSKTFNVRIWDANGTGGAPNTVLGTTTITYGTAASDVANTRFTVATFNPPVTVNGAFYAGIEFAYASGDTLALITNEDGQTNPATAWEKLSNNAWLPYSSTNSWEQNVSHLIAAVVCGASPSAPVANFTNTTTTICAGSSVTFTNTSTGNPTAYSWTFQGGTPSTSTAQNPVVTYNTAGTYNVALTVSNTNGSNTKTQNSLVTVRARPVLSLSATNATCGNNGAVAGNLSSGQPPYNFTWSNGATTQNLSNLSGGSYTATVTDANGCSAVASATVANQGVTVSANVNNVSLCEDNNDGIIILTVTNGVAPITYSWSNGANTASIFGLAKGSYSVTVNTNGCSFTDTYTITAPAAIDVLINYNTCNQWQQWHCIGKCKWWSSSLWLRMEQWRN